MKQRLYNNRKRTPGRNFKYVQVTKTEKIGRKKITSTFVRKIRIESRIIQYMNYKKNNPYKPKKYLS